MVSSVEPSSSGAGTPSGRASGLVLKALLLLGGALLLKRMRKSATGWDHARAVTNSLVGEKFSREQARRDPDNYFNIRMVTCPATEMVDSSKVLYFEQAFWRTPQKPFRQLSSYAIRDMEEYKNFCDRPKGQRIQPEEVFGDIAEHLTTIHLSHCERGKRCLYEGSSPQGGFPNTWGGASFCSSDLTIHKNGEVHTWDRGYDEEGNQVWGPKTGSYEFKPARQSTNYDMFSPLNSRPTLSLDKLESPFVVHEQ